MPVNKYDPIPDPEASIDSLLRTVKAMKMTVEQLTGQTPNLDIKAPNRNFVQRNTPEAFSQGDLWTKLAVLAGEVPIVSIWNGSKWVVVN